MKLRPFSTPSEGHLGQEADPVFIKSVMDAQGGCEKVGGHTLLSWISTIVNAVAVKEAGVNEL